MPVSKHNTKKGSNANWKRRARKFKDVQAVKMKTNSLMSTRNPLSLIKSLSWKKGDGKSDKLTLKKRLTNMFRRRKV